MRQITWLQKSGIEPPRCQCQDDLDSLAPKGHGESPYTVLRTVP